MGLGTDEKKKRSYMQETEGIYIENEEILQSELSTQVRIMWGTFKESAAETKKMITSRREK